jgi:hypothetical protein
VTADLLGQFAQGRPSITLVDGVLDGCDAFRCEHEAGEFTKFAADFRLLVGTLKIPARVVTSPRHLTAILEG